MKTKQQISTESVEIVNFPSENLQVSENSATFAETVDEYDPNLLNMENMTTPLAFQDEMPVFKRLATVAEYANMTPAEQARYDYELKKYRDHYAQMDWATKKGLMEGEAKGRAEGAAEERIKNAIAFKKAGASIEMIASALNMTIEEVEALPTE